MSDATRDPLDELSDDVIAFADKVFDKFDVGEVVTARSAAAAGRVSQGTAKECIEKLRAARCWPYRSAKWRAQGWTFARLSA